MNTTVYAFNVYAITIVILYSYIDTVREITIVIGHTSHKPYKGPTPEKKNNKTKRRILLLYRIIYLGTNGN